MKKTQKNRIVAIAWIRTWRHSLRKKSYQKKQEGHQGVKSAKNFTSYSLDADCKSLNYLFEQILLRSRVDVNLFDIFFYSFAEEKKTFLKDNKIELSLLEI